jgi:hypothetical protein
VTSGPHKHPIYGVQFAGSIRNMACIPMMSAFVGGGEPQLTAMCEGNQVAGIVFGLGLECSDNHSVLLQVLRPPPCLASRPGFTTCRRNRAGLGSRIATTDAGFQQPVPLGRRRSTGLGPSP